MDPQVVTSRPTIGVVVPCYNEAESLEATASAISRELDALRASGIIADASFACFVDDGSKDGTWAIIEALSRAGRGCRGVKLSRNVRHQRALLAGLLEMRGQADALISMDADLQDPANTIPKFVEEYLKGAEIVYGVRDDRSTDTFFKRATAHGFYRLMSGLGVDVIEHHADCRLLGRRALQALSQFGEANLFLRGIVPLIGYRSTAIYYHRSSRVAGESKYPLRKMIAFAWDGITSFSTAPLVLIAWLGCVVCLGVGAVSVWAFVTWLSGRALQGWTSTVLPLLFIGGVQLLCTGIIGQYLGKVYQEVKRRPTYFVDRTSGEPAGLHDQMAGPSGDAIAAGRR
jgi:glycosyltransferase involved in cell wall biosynthesis